MSVIEIPMKWAKPLRDLIEAAAEHISEYNMEHLYDIDVIREIYAEVGGNRDDIF